MKLKGVLLEISKGEYEGNAYASVKLRSADIANNQILKYKVDVKRVDVDSLEPFLDHEVKVECSVIKGAYDSATLKVVSVVA
jgi:hypothetical protein